MNQPKNVVRVLGLLVMLTVSWATAATRTVTNTNDAGAGSLRQTIQAAASGDIIDFDASLAGQTITLTGNLPDITIDNLTIDASALGGKVTIDGDGNYRIFNHTGSGTFAINNLVVTGARISGGDGGGIYSNGNVTVTGSIISSNVANSGGSPVNGGGIYSNGDVTVTNSTISGNEVMGGGGGIRSNGNVTVTNSTISGNKGKAAGASGGGGISSNGNVTVTDSTISENEVADVGGGIFSNGDVTVTNSTISGNSANLGGGIFSGDVVVTLIDSTITGNTASNSVGGINSGLDIVFSGCTTVENNTAPTNSQWYADSMTSDDNGALAQASDDPYVGECSTGDSVINPNQDIQIRNGATTAAASITSGSVVNIGAFKRGEVATVDFLVRNPGAKVLELGELSLPSFLSNAGEPLPETLASFGSALLTLSVDTSAAGALEGAFSLASNDPDSFENPFVFTVTGSVSNEPANAINILPGIDLGDISAATGEDNVVLLSFKLLVPAGSTSVTVDSLTLTASNAGIERASNLRLYIDGGTRGELDNRDVFLSSTTDTEALTFNFPARTFSPELPMWFVVVGDF